MNYNPNFRDPRIQSRTRQALGFVQGCFSETKPMSWSTRYIDRYLGSQRNDFSKWLRSHLIIEYNSHYNKDTGECKQYLLNRIGVEYVRERLTGQSHVQFDEWAPDHACRFKNSLKSLVEYTEEEQPPSYPSVVEVSTPRVVNEWVTDQFKTELTTHVFDYDDKSNRLWHPLQRVRRCFKKAALADHDLVYQYDIECAAPTLLLQYSQQLPLKLDANNNWTSGPCDIWLPALNQYVNNKTQCRRDLATAADITIEQAKIIINALFAGAQLSLNPTTEIFQMLGGDRIRIEYLKQDSFLVQLRTDIKIMWDYIKTTLSRRKSASGRFIPISSKQKWGLYFDLERKILDVVRKYLTEIGNAHFLEHDGWTCVNEIDELSLRSYIKSQTGFDIKLSCELLTRSHKE